ncbi:MAG: cation-translocating P-type ATPase, partial [Pseudomonadota bacterium]
PGGSLAVWKDGLLAGITMAMSILPEELPVILTIFLALGAWRISRSRVLTRRMPAIETLGAATVLCVDKTGTLTQNQMTLKKLRIGKHSILLKDSQNQALSENFGNLLTTAVLASKPDPFDPMEKAIHLAGKGAQLDVTHLYSEWTMVQEYPLTPELLAVSHVWARKTGENLRMIASKGAPEAIADLCHLTPQERESLAKEVVDLASQGLRVLGVASTDLSSKELPAEHHDLPLKFLGLIGLEDPLRSTVPAAVLKCQTAGIRIVMITGDYPVTAQSIARQAGLANYQTVITGPELEKMSDEVLAERIKNVQIFARVVPEQKLRLVMALKANKEVVAMTGDGVNDAPALKAAHIGIAMGGRGTDVARESASLVLLDDDFSSIVDAIQLGRRIFDNIKKAIAFTFAVHVPIAGLSMFPIFFSEWPLLLLPVHIVFLELIIDPSCSLIFEAEEAEANIMSKPPRNPTERLFSMKTIGLALLQGFSVLIVCLGIFVFSRGHHSPDMARALTFLTLVVSFLMIILTNRSWTRSIMASMRMPNKALWWVLGGTAGFLSLVLMFPPAQKLFHFAPLHTLDVVISLVAGLICVMWFEVLKFTKWLKTA